MLACVASSSAGDTILLNPTKSYAPSAPLDITHNLTIKTDPTLIAANGAATLNGGSITNPSTLDSGQHDIIVVGNGATLTLDTTIFTATTGSDNGDLVVMSGGILSMNHSLISSNQGNSVDVMAGGTATVTNTTITQSNSGSAVVDDGTINLNSDTLANNDNFNIDNGGGGAANLTNTILSGGGIRNCNLAIDGVTNGTFTHSIDSGTSCGFGTSNGSLSSESTGVLGTFGSHGGPTNTFSLVTSPTASPAINAGTTVGAPKDDQRLLLRNDGSPDIGAFENGGATPVAVTLTVITSVNNTGGGTAQASDFTVTVTDTTTGTPISPTPIAGSATGIQVTVPAGDSWSVAESGAQSPNYDETTVPPSAGCTGSAQATGTASCTITETFKVGTCVQPSQQNSANTCVTANVATTLIVTAPSTISFPALAPGESSTTPANLANVNVLSNNPDGYVLNVTRTVFSNGDIPLAIASGVVSAPMMQDLGGPVGGPSTAPVAIPTSTTINIGHNNTLSASSPGDVWPVNLTLGPIPWAIPAGQHTATVTYTAVANP